MENIELRGEILDELGALYDVSDMQVEKVSGGIARESYKIKLKSGDVYLLRMYKESKFSDVDKELFYFKKLSEIGFGPKLIYEGKNFRLEEFFECRNIKASEIISYHRQLACLLGKLHSTNYGDNDDSSVNTHKNFIKEKLDAEWLVNAYKQKCNFNLYPNSTDREFIVKLIDANFFEKEKEYIFNEINKEEEEQVVSHNDIWVNNIIICKNGVVKIIDYEVMQYNFRSYDLGKLILESIFERHTNGIFYHLEPSQFPTKEQIIEFILYYLYAAHLNGQSNAEVFDVKERLVEYYKTPEELLNQVNKLYSGIYKGIISACLYLTIMGVALGREFSKDLDMFEFAVDHYKLYIEFKEKYMNLEKIIQ
jgi:thiamine kinase-like enzyme